jgi:hypothetical protein
MTSGRPFALLLAALLGACLAMPRWVVAAGPATATTATIEIDESYAALRSLDKWRRPVDVPVALPTLSLPFRSVMEALLVHAGVATRRDAGASADISVRVTCEGTTYGQLYDTAIQSRRIRGLRYTDAAIFGTLRFETGDVVVERTFAGEVAPAVTIIGIVDGGDVRSDPNYAPFRAAFEAPGGFLDVLGDAVREVWGQAPLRAALADRDPLVREAALRALD